MANLADMLEDLDKQKPEDNASNQVDGSLDPTIFSDKSYETKPSDSTQTLEDWSLLFSDGKKVSPKDYLLYFLRLMIQNKASDIYFTYWEEPALRVYGEIYRVNLVPKLEDTTLEAISRELMTVEDQDLYKKYLSCDLGYSAFWRRYRINISRQRWHKMIVARLLEEKIPTIDELWLPEILKTLINKTSGIVFVAWPTWSWKSTTLAAMIEEINVIKSCHVLLKLPSNPCLFWTWSVNMFCCLCNAISCHAIWCHVQVL